MLNQSVRLGISITKHNRKEIHLRICCHWSLANEMSGLNIMDGPKRLWHLLGLPSVPNTRSWLTLGSSEWDMATGIGLSFPWLRLPGLKTLCNGKFATAEEPCWPMPLTAQQPRYQRGGLCVMDGFFFHKFLDRCWQRIAPTHRCQIRGYRV